jgi:DnaJ-class molecular chaperone
MRPSERDAHQILGVSRDAGTRRIKAAYRRLAKQFHPDRNPTDLDAEDKFKEIQWAYEEILSSKGQRGSQTISTEVEFGFSHDDTHPFFSFLSAVRAYYGKKEKG